MPSGFEYFGMPTIFFIDSNGTSIGEILGSSRAKPFLQQLKQIIKEEVCENCDFSDAEIEHSNFGNNELGGAKFYHNNLTDSNLTGAILWKTKFKDTTLTQNQCEEAKKEEALFYEDVICNN